MTMNIVGTVTTKSEQSVGHSQVRITVAIDLGDGKSHPAEIIISTDDQDVIGAFRVRDTVAFSGA